MHSSIIKCFKVYFNKFKQLSFTLSHHICVKKIKQFLQIILGLLANENNNGMKMIYSSFNKLLNHYFLITAKCYIKTLNYSSFVFVLKRLNTENDSLRLVLEIIYNWINKVCFF